MGGERPADRELGQDGDEVVLVPVLVGVAEDEIERAGEGRHELVGVGQARVDEASSPASRKLATASRCRPSSMSTVMSLPPVLLRAQAIQIPEWPVDVPISRARVYLFLTMRS